MFIRSPYARDAEIGFINIDLHFKESFTYNLLVSFTFRPHSKNCKLCDNRSQKGHKEIIQYIKRIFKFTEHDIGTTKSETDTATETGLETETGSDEPGTSAIDPPDKSTAGLKQEGPEGPGTLT